jgi:hypothetical protein
MFLRSEMMMRTNTGTTGGVAITIEKESNLKIKLAQFGCIT